MMALFVFTMTQSVDGFSLSMEHRHPDNSYKPPVQRSVRKLLQQRRTTTSTTGTHHPSSPSTDTNKRSAFAGTLSMPTPATSSFEERMRTLVQKKRPPTTTPRSARPSTVQVVDNLLQYKQVVGDERQQFVVVRFFAGYCKACQAVAPHFYKLSKTFENMKFVDVPVSSKNASLHQGLGVSSLPYLHIYHPTLGLVHEQKFTRPHVAQVQEKLQTYRASINDQGANVEEDDV